MQEINVEVIMAEIRKEIKEKEYKESDLSFNDKWKITNNTGDDIANLKIHLEQLSNSKYIPFYRELSGNSIVRLIKKIIRKMTAFLIWPIIEEQNRYNEEIYELLCEIVEKIEKNKN